MNRYTKEEKAIFRLLCEQDITDIKLVGNVIQSVPFKSGTSALLVDCSNKTAKLFYPIKSQNKHEDRKEFVKLVSLLSLIEEAEKKGLIYIQQSNANCELFFYENLKENFLMGCPVDLSVKHHITQCEKIEFDIDTTNTVPLQGEQAATIKSDPLYITRNGKRIMRSTDVTCLYERIEHYLCCRAFSTSVLSRFIDNGFCLDEEKRSITSLKYSIASFFVAMLALIVSMPCISVWYSNKYGYSTMNSVQYQQLLNKVDTIKESLIENNETKKIGKIKSSIGKKNSVQDYIK